ncbi:MAG: hypothetical protein SWH61_06080 [Thermodesulfobacteriota bacterium]|nr:hypothetical protein [Thermodesulfobacteriota bacterium]
MSNFEIGILLTVGGGLFIVAVFLRAKTGGKYEIKMSDLALALIPLLFWLIGTGKIKKFAFGGFEVETAQAFIGASEKEIKSQVALSSPLSIEDVVQTPERGAKTSVAQIPRLIKQKTEALEFRLGHGGYWGPAIQQYFESLDAYSFLRYTIIHHQNGTLFGVFEARDLLHYFRQEGEDAYHRFAASLNHPDQQSLERLRDLPGFIPGEFAVMADANKRTVLEKMETLKRNTLPVVTSDRRYTGMVDRTQLTASLIIDVARNLEQLESK